MAEVNELFDNLTVIKRNGKKVDFDGSKIALAIKKGFDSVEVDDDEIEKERKYTTKDIQKVYQAVLKRIEKDSEEKNNRFKIEEIQDYIESELSNKGYDDVYKSFSEYRERRNQSRESFFGDNKTHKFLKSLENLGLKVTVRRRESDEEEGTVISQSQNEGTVLKAGDEVAIAVSLGRDTSSENVIDNTEVPDEPVDNTIETNTTSPITNDVA